MEEVFNAEEADACVVLSEAFGAKQVLKKIYFKGYDIHIADMIIYVALHYGCYIDEGVRIDTYRMCNGLTYARI